MDSDVIGNDIWTKVLSMLEDVANTPQKVLEVDYSKSDNLISLNLADVGTVDKNNQIRSVLSLIELLKKTGRMDWQTAAIFMTFTVLPLLDTEKRNQLLDILKEAETDSNAIGENEPSSFQTALQQVRSELASIRQNGVLPKQLYHAPRVLNMINTKATNVLFDPNYQEQIKVPVDIMVGGAKKDLAVQTQLFVSVADDNIMDEKEVRLSQTLTAYDRMVYDAVCSVLFANGDMLVTTRQIYEAFAGKTTNSPQALGHVTRSLNKMRSTILYLDCTDHVRSIDPRAPKMVFDENLLSFSRITFSSGGKEVSGYRFLKMPILFEYAMKVKQLITVPRALLEVETISSTDTNNLIKTYLLRRIEMMKTKHNSITSNRIKYDAMLEYLGISAGSKVEYKRIRDTVRTILDCWTKQGYIKGYTEVKEGRRFSGVEILYQAKPER